MKSVVKIKGHQYLVSEGDRLLVERIKAEPGEKVYFEDVYLSFDDKNVWLGKPRVSGAKVEAKVLRHLRGKKVIVFKYKPKTRYRVKRGFRPELTEIEISRLGR